MSSKQIVVDLLAELPEDVTLAKIVEELSILAAVERSERHLAEGRQISQAELEISVALDQARQASADGRVSSVEAARRAAANWRLP
jgi:hypothetical protein